MHAAHRIPTLRQHRCHLSVTGLVRGTPSHVIEDNTVLGNTNGVFLAAGVAGNFIRRNLIVGNPPVQIDLDHPSASGVDIKNLADEAPIPSEATVASLPSMRLVQRSDTRQLGDSSDEDTRIAVMFIVPMCRADRMNLWTAPEASCPTEKLVPDGIRRFELGHGSLNRDAALPRTLRKLLKSPSRLSPALAFSSRLLERAYGHLTATDFELLRPKNIHLLRENPPTSPSTTSASCAVRM